MPLDFGNNFYERIERIQKALHVFSHLLALFTSNLSILSSKDFKGAFLCLLVPNMNEVAPCLGDLEGAKGKHTKHATIKNMQIRQSLANLGHTLPSIAKCQLSKGPAHV